jgi:hypothetical protein
MPVNIQYNGTRMKSWRARRLFLLCPLWVGPSQYQWAPGSPSLLYDHTSPWGAALRVTRVSICPLSILLLSPPVSLSFSAGLSIGCSGGRDAPASGVPSCLSHCTTRISCCLDFGTCLGSSPLMCFRTLVGIIWLPED